ncbi:MAG: hypothetical protein U9P71_09450 [Campylobacterota bacterium]|nr:hypothetical protein [Campylobacterota bacterium]
MDPYQIETLKNYQSSIVYLKLLNDGTLAIATKNRKIIFLNLSTGEHRTLQLDSKFLFEKSKISITESGKFIAYLAHDNTMVHIINSVKNKIIQSFNAYGHTLDIISFDPSSHYLLAGTSEGRVLTYSLLSGSFLNRIASFPEHTASELIGFKNSYVSSFSFYKSLFISSGYGGSVVLLNINTLTQSLRFHNGRSKIDALAFINNDTFLEGNGESTLKKVSICEHRVLKQISLSIGSIQHIVLLNNLPFVLVSSKFNSISLVNILTMELIKKEFITTSSNITDIVCTRENSIYIAQENGDLLHVNLLPLKEFNELIEHDYFEQAYKLSEHNILLRHTKDFLKLETLFSLRYTNALKLLISLKVEEAKLELKAFKNAKKDDYIALFKNFKHYESMKLMHTQKKYASIYGLTQKWPLLKMTPVYKKLEKKWQNCFNEAYELVVKHDEVAAKKNLYDFFTISEKRPLISLLFSDHKYFSDLTNALKGNNIARVEQIIQKYPQLKNTPQYIEHIVDYDKEISSLNYAIKSYDFSTTQTILNEIEGIAHLHKIYEQMNQTFKSVKKFFYFYEKRKLYNCFQLIDSRKELSILKELEILEKQWNMIIYRCEKSAAAGNIVAIKKDLGSLIKLKSRSEKTGTLLRAAYRIQIKASIDKKDMKRYHNGVINYINFFGTDDELNYLITQVKKKPFSKDTQKDKLIRKERIAWLKDSFKLPSNITDGIIA